MFLDDMIEYISECVDSDAELPSINVLQSYKYAHETKTTEIQVMVADDAENSRWTTFEGERVSRIPVLITVYGTQNKIGDETYSAQKVCEIITSKVIGWLQTDSVRGNVDGVISTRRTSFSYAMPVDTGSKIYASAIRCEVNFKR